MTLQSLVEEGKVMARTRAAIIVAGAVLILVTLGVFKACRDPGNTIPEKDQRTIDSLRIMKPSFDSSAAAGRLAVVHDTVVSVVYRTKVQRVLVSAAADRSLADSLTRLASIATTAADSALAYHEALKARTREADSLRVATALADSAWQAEHSALVRMTSIYVADTLRRVSSENLNVRLARDVVVANQCRILWVAKCPSRTVAAISTALIVEVARVALGKP